MLMRLMNLCHNILILKQHHKSFTSYVYVMNTITTMYLGPFYIMQN